MRENMGVFVAQSRIYLVDMLAITATQHSSGMQS